MSCAVCGRAITAEIQKGHTYYRCTGHGGCEQKSIYTREEDLEKQIIESLSSLEINDQEFLDWLKDAMREAHKEKANFHATAIDNLQTQYNRLQQRIENLYIDKLDGEITKAKYDELSNKYRAEQDHVSQKIESHQKSDEKYFELGAKLIDFADQAKKLYLEKSKEQKREIIRFAFLNLRLQDKKLSVSLHPALLWFNQKRPSAKSVSFGCGGRI